MVEFLVEDVSRFIGEEILRIESMETIAFLRDTPDEVALICRVRFKDSSYKPRTTFGKRWTRTQILEQDRKGVYTMLLQNKRTTLHEKLDSPLAGAYISTPYEIMDDKVKATFLGAAFQIRKLLQVFTKSSVKYKVISLADARFPQDSPLSRLTDIQRKVLITSYNLGYYDLPKKISSEELAEKLNMRSSTLVIHRIKAEKRLLNEILSRQ